MKCSSSSICSFSAVERGLCRTHLRQVGAQIVKNEETEGRGFAVDLFGLQVRCETLNDLDQILQRYGGPASASLPRLRAVPMSSLPLPLSSSVPRAVVAAKPAKLPKPPQTKVASVETKVSEPVVESRIRPTALSGVESAPIEWFWQHRIPQAMLTVLYAPPGVGKGTLTAALAAVVTSGGKLPGDDKARVPGRVLFAVAEDSLKLTLRPRLDAAGADASRVEVFGPDLRLRLPKNIVDIEAAVRDSGATLVVIDPLRGFTNGDSRSQVRAVLTGLEDMAVRTGAAVLVVHHTNKVGDVHGSQDIVGIPRSLLVIDDEFSEGLVRVVRQAKKNLAPDVASARFRIVDHGGVGVVKWVEEEQKVVELPLKKERKVSKALLKSVPLGDEERLDKNAASSDSQAEGTVNDAAPSDPAGSELPVAGTEVPVESGGPDLAAAEKPRPLAAKVEESRGHEGGLDSAAEAQECSTASTPVIRRLRGNSGVTPIEQDPVGDAVSVPKTSIGFLEREPEVPVTVDQLEAYRVERNRIERQKVAVEARKRTAASGKPPGRVPWGLKYTDETGWKLTDDATVVRELFRRVSRGESTQSIADNLNSREVSAPRKTFRGRLVKWTRGTVHDLVKRDVYCGTWRANRDAVICVPAIVDEALWSKAQEALTANKLRGLLNQKELPTQLAAPEESADVEVDLDDSVERDVPEVELTAMIVSVERWVHKIARKHFFRIQDSGALEYEDLVSVGRAGALKAARRWDPARGTKFLSYASHWIESFVRREVTGNRHTIRVPHHLQDGRTVEGDTFRAINARMRLTSKNLPLDAPLPGRDRSETLKLSDVLAVEVEDDPLTVEQDEQVVAIRQILDSHPDITDKDIAIFERYVFSDGEYGTAEHVTLESIGDEYNLSRERIRQIVYKIRNIVREELEAKMATTETQHVAGTKWKNTWPGQWNLYCKCCRGAHRTNLITVDNSGGKYDWTVRQPSWQTGSESTLEGAQGVAMRVLATMTEAVAKETGHE